MKNSKERRCRGTHQGLAILSLVALLVGCGEGPLEGNSDLQRRVATVLEKVEDRESAIVAAEVLRNMLDEATNLRETPVFTFREMQQEYHEDLQSWAELRARIVLLREKEDIWPILKFEIENLNRVQSGTGWLFDFEALGEQTR